MTTFEIVSPIVISIVFSVAFIAGYWKRMMDPNDPGPH
jgi:hypothetical protein